MNEKMRSCVKGLILSLFGNPLPAAPSREPVAYLYNGVRLPGLPESELPYKYISYSESYGWYRFCACSNPGYWETGGIASDKLSNDSVQAVYFLDSKKATEWETDIVQSLVLHNNASVASGAKITLLWSNVDVYEQDGSTILVTASDPIPVYE